MDFQPWAAVIALPPFIGVLALSAMLSRGREKRRYPFNDSVLRPPGESCRIKVEELYDVALWKTLSITLPIFIALSAYYAKASVVACIVLTFIAAAITTYVLIQLRATVLKIGAYRLGFEGERIVGQFLSEGLSLGWRVFHDVPFDGFNIDHVVVAPMGVFCIETKTRSKSLDVSKYKLKFDGEKLFGPDWTKDEPLKQASLNAKHLSEWLRKSVGERVWVEPILTMPGWFIQCTDLERANVMNPKNIISYIDCRKTKALLSPELIQRISHQIEQRDVIS